ncbi:MAG: ATP-binding cassette domain-containing protein [Alphaproteobacteria bacterium]|nr:ATP-binding cassette domain-containing protein [Alphaproteobacteria bacterium]
MPAGLGQIVGASGWQLSHGERSRVFLARALLQGARLIVLDESFAALDPVTLKRCLEVVEAFEGTVVVVGTLSGLTQVLSTTSSPSSSTSSTCPPVDTTRSGRTSASRRRLRRRTRQMSHFRRSAWRSSWSRQISRAMASQDMGPSAATSSLMTWAAWPESTTGGRPLRCRWAVS